MIHAEIVRRLETADLVLCDLSTLNPNVFFELGIRTALDRPVSIVRDSLTTIVPFDTSLINNWTYDHSLAPWVLTNQITALYEHLVASLNQSDGRNNLWQVFGLTTRASRADTDSDTDGKLDLILAQLQRQSETNLPRRRLASTRTGENESSFDQFTQQASDIAAQVSARITSATLRGNQVELDLGGYGLPDALLDKIASLGSEHGLEVRFTGEFTR